MAVNPTPDPRHTGVIGETENLLKLPHINPASEQEVRLNHQWLENWGNRLPKVVYRIAWFSDQSVPGDDTNTYVGTIRVQAGTTYLLSYIEDGGAVPFTTLVISTDPVPYGLSSPIIVLKWTGKQGYVDVKFYFKVNTSGAGDWPLDAILLEPVEVQGPGAHMAPLTPIVSVP